MCLRTLLAADGLARSGRQKDHSLRGLYTVGDYNDDPARLRALTMPALIVTGAQTVSFHRAMNESLLRTQHHEHTCTAPHRVHGGGGALVAGHNEIDG